MPRMMNGEQLRQLFCSNFDLQRWKTFIADFFTPGELRGIPEPIPAPEGADAGYYLGAMMTKDSYRIGLFVYTVSEGSVSHRRAGLRQWVKRFINPLRGEFDAALVVYDDKNSDEWRLSFICDIKGEKTDPKRYTYVFGGNDQLYKTPVERFTLLKKKGISFEHLREAFSVEALSKEFFDNYRQHYGDFVAYITGKRYIERTKGWVEEQIQEPHPQLQTQFAGDEKRVRDYIKKLLGRIVFLYYLQRKGWLGVPQDKDWGEGDLDFMRHLFEYASQAQKDDFVETVLEPLFYGALNTDRSKSGDLFDTQVHFPNIGTSLRIPYLNGGLFETDENDQLKVIFPAEYFEHLLDFFSQYNFTIDENDPSDAQVGVDPEMLGRIFESLLEDNKEKGAYYTPKEIVQYMCRESLTAYLRTVIDPEKEQEQSEAIARFVKSGNDEDLCGYTASGVQYDLRTEVLNKLKEVKICDPAIGSGAFPMGLLRELYHCRIALEEASVSPAEIKSQIIKNNIYGVDIERGAVDIARLRFWLSLVVDEETPQPLPNLDYKIMQGNSLLESYQGVDLSTLTQRKQEGDICLFDDMADVYRRKLRQAVSAYYSETNHEHKEKLHQDISEAIEAQLTEQCYQVDLSKIDLSANTHFFLWHTWFDDVFNRPSGRNGFDIVIGNPPYVKEYVNRHAFDGFRETSPYYIGKMDLWYGFACHGIDLLCQGGHLCFIAQNNWTTSAGAKKMRNKIVEDARIRQILDFKSYMVFENANIQTMIMLFEKNQIADNYGFDYRILMEGATKEDMLALLNMQICRTIYRTQTFSRSNYANNTFTFLDNTLIFNKISEGKVYLQNNEVTQGIVFPQDFLNEKGAAKLENRFPIGSGIFGLSYDEMNKLNLTDSEKSVIKPYFSTEQIGRYYTIPSNSKWLIYTDSSFKRANSMDDYPHIKSHLDQFIDIFTSDNKPYGLHRCRKEKFFQGEKIISLRKCVERPCFSYSDFDCYVAQTFFSIKTLRWDMKFLTGVLNSKLVAFWLRHKGKMQGSNYQVDKEPLLGIPLPLIDLSLQQPIIGLVEEILSKKKLDPQSDISDLENEIDSLVYSLYGLSEDEIKIVESN